MKRLTITLLCLLFILSMSSCKKEDFDKPSPETEIVTAGTSQNEITSDKESENMQHSTKTPEANSEKAEINLYINDTKVPVKWEENAAVSELMADASDGGITVSMSMYSDFEQVGSLGKNYSRNDRQTTTHCGDIVLYNGSNIVVFYGSNSWSYTRLGKIDLPDKEVKNLLSNGDVTLTITR